MKKIALLACALAFPVVASAQVQLISGFNFGQFLFPGYPTVDEAGFGTDPIGHIGSNFSQNSTPTLQTSGSFFGQVGYINNYTDGSSTMYWDGTNGSTVFALDGAAISTPTFGGVQPTNSLAVNGVQMMLFGDDGFLGLNTTVPGSLSWVVDTTGFADFAPANQFGNLTFGAAANTGDVTISWLLNGAATGLSTIVSGGWASYTVDLPTGFYGDADAQLSAAISGGTGLTLDNVQFNGMVDNVIPEPSTYAMILGAITLGVATMRRRKNAIA